MFDNDPISPRDVARFIRSARLAEVGKMGMLSHEEQIAGAFLTGRTDLLPVDHRHPIDAMKKLGSAGLNTLLYVHQRGWRSEYDSIVETLG